jgi:hypothetical protein
MVQPKRPVKMQDFAYLLVAGVLTHGHGCAGHFHDSRRAILRCTRTSALNEEDGMKSAYAVNPHHAVTVSQQRLGKRVAQLSAARMNEVCAALRFSLGCDAS